MDIQSLKKLALLAHIKKPSNYHRLILQNTSIQASKQRQESLKALEEEKLISRQFLPDGQLISITKNGIDTPA